MSGAVFCFTHRKCPESACSRSNHQRGYVQSARQRYQRKPAARTSSLWTFLPWTPTTSG
ncbi:hypothetical protein DM02DRAFT_411325 [Periconia macrospinosa]|uniref:Uncharacterized protein n=1 Tax=Periconia macrospinosa TaxID=97972 RepID=A0A2V1DS32_9PLEO|nr:hypothetical protein DM02DRAFT_411325 [Periconia macrospinosa]